MYAWVVYQKVEQWDMVSRTARRGRYPEKTRVRNSILWKWEEAYGLLFGSQRQEMQITVLAYSVSPSDQMSTK